MAAPGAGCLAYDLFQDLSCETTLAFLESWEDQAHLDAHMQSEHFKRIAPLLDGLKEPGTWAAPHYTSSASKRMIVMERMILCHRPSKLQEENIGKKNALFLQMPKMPRLGTRSRRPRVNFHNMPQVPNIF